MGLGVGKRLGAKGPWSLKWPGFQACHLISSMPSTHLCSWSLEDENTEIGNEQLISEDLK